MEPGKQLYALVDGNSFYANCERVFKPHLRNKPVCVLSSNDGNVVARSDEVKQLGIKMGAPFHEIQNLVKQHDIACFSSNFQLYSSLSNRFMDILRTYTPTFYQYSIDEGFMLVNGMFKLWESPTVMGHHIKKTTLQYIGIPVGIGFAGSQGLAKAANHIAKKDKSFNGVCDLSSMTDADIDDLLNQYPVFDAWGVGSRIGERLMDMGVETMGALRRAPTKWLRQQFGVVMERVGLELRGYACLEPEEVPQPKKQIVTSRSFGIMLSDIQDLIAAISAYVAISAEKLRKQGSVCGAINVFISTNRFRPQDPQYSNGITIPMTEPTDDTRRLTAAALFGLKYIFQSGFQYKKAGVALMDISSAQTIQASLFYSDEAREKSSNVMKALDEINQRYGRGTLRLASAGHEAVWTPRAEYKSKRYTTSWDEIPVIK